MTSQSGNIKLNCKRKNHEIYFLSCSGCNDCPCYQSRCYQHRRNECKNFCWTLEWSLNWNSCWCRWVLRVHNSKLRVFKLYWTFKPGLLFDTDCAKELQLSSLKLQPKRPIYRSRLILKAGRHILRLDHRNWSPPSWGPSTEPAHHPSRVGLYK